MGGANEVGYNRRGKCSRVEWAGQVEPGVMGGACGGPGERQ